MSKFTLVLLVLAGTIITSTGFAQQVFTYPDAIFEGNPTFNRPNEACTVLSNTTTTVSILPIRVEISGEYSIFSQQNGFDGYLFVYEANLFDLDNPLAGCLAANDDNDGDRNSSLIPSVTLLADVTYFIVVSGFNSFDLGEFENTIEGPGRSEESIIEVRSGSTVGGQTFARPFASCDALSGNGSNSAFSARVFSVSTTAEYSVRSEQDFDGYIHVYDERFNPFDPLLGCLAGDDDGPSGAGTSEIESVRLVAGRTYYLVTSGFNDNESGTFTNTLTGPGAFFAEPGIFTLASLTGGWFDPNFNGSGFNIVAADVGIVFTFYGYINGEQRWLLTNVISNEIRIGQQVTATLRIGDGGQLNDPGAADVVTFGTLFFELIDCTNAVAIIEGEGPFQGIGEFFNLRLLVQGTGPQCPQ